VTTELSEAMLRQEGVEPRRMVRLAPSVDMERFAVGSDAEGRRRLGLETEDEIVLCVARLVPEKGVHHLLEACARLTPGLPRLRLVVAGSGPLRQQLEDRAGRPELAGRVSFVGEVAHEQMPPLYAAADLFVLPSVATRQWQEQWGQSLLEAMAAGLPCVASLTGGVPEVLGKAGVGVPPAEPEALARAMAALLEDQSRRRELGEMARRRARDCFDARSRGPELARLFGELTGRGS
jgi:glycosyltransferase involved in cell wall biosynthesis